MSQAKADSALGAMDRTGQAALMTAGRVARGALGGENSDKAVALAQQLNAKAEEAAKAVHARGRNYCRLVNVLVDAFAGFFARYSCIVFFFNLVGFILSACLLAYTEQNSDPSKGFGCVT
jgi:hypothetical protein